MAEISRDRQILTATDVRIFGNELAKCDHSIGHEQRFNMGVAIFLNNIEATADSSCCLHVPIPFPAPNPPSVAVGRGRHFASLPGARTQICIILHGLQSMRLLSKMQPPLPHRIGRSLRRRLAKVGSKCTCVFVGMARLMMCCPSARTKTNASNQQGGHKFSVLRPQTQNY